MFGHGQSRSATAAIALQGDAFGGSVVSDRCFVYNHLPAMPTQLWLAHGIGDLTAIAERHAPVPRSKRSCWGRSGLPDPPPPHNGFGRGQMGKRLTTRAYLAQKPSHGKMMMKRRSQVLPTAGRLFESSKGR
jgi:hypothetical protein